MTTTARDFGQGVQLISQHEHCSHAAALTFAQLDGASGHCVTPSDYLHHLPGFLGNPWTPLVRLRR